MAPLNFRYLGGSYHLVITDVEALSRIHELDPARWTVTSVPTRDLRCDPGFIEYMDTEKRGRLLISRVVSARDWLFKNLKNRAHLVDKTETLVLEHIDTTHEVGQGIRAAGERVLRETEAKDRTKITLAQVREYKAAYLKALANGDGVVCAEVIPDEPVAQYVTDAVATIGGTAELSGRTGIDRKLHEKFLDGIKGFLEWRSKGIRTDDTLDTAVHVWGADTEAAAALAKKLAPKIDQFFWQCDLVREQPETASRFVLNEDELKAINVADAAGIEKLLTVAPLAPPNPEGLLAFDAKLNPFYAKDFGALVEKVVRRALGPDTTVLSRDSWKQVLDTFKPYESWMGEKPKEPFDKLPLERVMAYSAGTIPAQFEGFLELDEKAAPELAQLRNLEKLVLFQRWILELASNFVSLVTLYDPNTDTLFEAGSLVIDGRRLDFTIKIPDRAAHKKVATESRIFIVYATITEQDGKAALYEIAAPVTRGERGRLIAGKRGVFYSVDGKILDATITEVLEHPISVIEAVKAPFRRTAEFIGKKIEEFAAKRQKAAEASMQESVEKIGQVAAAEPGKEAAAKKPDGNLAAMLAGGGLAFAAIGSSMAYIFGALSKITPLDALQGISILVLVVVSLSAFLGWLKLRLRDLGPFFEANGWAVNPKLKVSGDLARIFNRRPPLPAGHETEIWNAKKDGSFLPDDMATDAGGVARLIIGLLTLLVVLVWIYNIKASKADAGERQRPAATAPAAAPAKKGS